MAINEKVLGPNSSDFTFSASETTTTIMATIDAYVTSHGWSIHDTNPNIATSGSGTIVGRVYRTLQAGSATVYKYVAISISNSSIQLRVYESWNATTHVGTNDGTYFGNNNTSMNYGTLQVGVDGYGFALFVNQKWLAIRPRSNTNYYEEMFGAFEINKEYGENPSFPSVIFMSSNYGLTYPSGDYYVGLFGSPRLITKGAAAYNMKCNTIITPFGQPGAVTSGNHVTMGMLLSSLNTTGTFNMLAAENKTAGGFAIDVFRGRIFGLKMVYGSAVWNDMDRVQVPIDANYLQADNGTPAAHLHIQRIGGNSIRFVIPA